MKTALLLLALYVALQLVSVGVGQLPEEGADE
jgi:hypothetical protein